MGTQMKHPEQTNSAVHVKKDLKISRVPKMGFFTKICQKHPKFNIFDQLNDKMKFSDNFKSLNLKLFFDFLTKKFV